MADNNNAPNSDANNPSNQEPATADTPGGGVPMTPFDEPTPATPGAAVQDAPTPGAARPPAPAAARRAAERVAAAASLAPTPVPQTPLPQTPYTPLGTAASPAGSVVQATPAPATPSRRRELGSGQVRLTPAGSVAPSPAPGGTPMTPAGEDGERMVIWGTNINYEDTSIRLTKFIENFKSTEQDEEPLYMQVLRNLAEMGGSIVNIDMSHLHKFDPGMYRTVVSFPSELIVVFDEVVSSVFTRLFPEEGVAIQERRRQALHARTYNLLSGNIQSMRDLNPKDISAMVAVRGMIIRASALIPDIQRAMYRCNKCRHMQESALQDGRISEPRACPSCRARDSFSLIHSRSAFADKQMVRLQEAPEAVPKGETPATFTLVMYDSLVDVTKPGDRVEVTGILRATPVRINPKMRTVRSIFRTYIDCIHIRVLNNNQARRPGGADKEVEKEAVTAGQSAGAEPIGEEYTQEQIEARNHRFEALSCHPGVYERLANSLAPSIFGMTDEKKGVLLQLFGGASKAGFGEANANTMADGSSRFRSAINILLVGDPGTSKSQLLHCAHRLAPRGVYTSGRGSSAVGLTAYVTRDPDTDEYVLESGALVLSDRGVCCIDEFDKMSDFARSVLHEAMEQQTVSIAKAGIIATLNARTSVLAAANPVHSRYDTSKSVVDNIDLPPTLLSRFDLIYLVLDAPNAEGDRRLAQHIVSLFYRNYDAPDDTTASASNADDMDDLLNDTPAAPTYSGGDFLNSRELTEYIAYARAKVDPRLSDSAQKTLIDGYMEMRAGGRGGSNITATPRQLESLIRLSEAHARMYLREEVEEKDVDEAMRLVKAAMHMAAYDPNTGKIDMNLFAMGQSRAAQVKVEALATVVLQKLVELRNKEGGDAGDVKTVELLNALREDSDADIAPGDVREALRRLEQEEKISMTKGGTHARLLA